MSVEACGSLESMQLSDEGGHCWAHAGGHHVQMLSLSDHLETFQQKPEITSLL